MKNIVTVGGGTGSYTVLSGLKNTPDISLTALVSMADDGGSTGDLRRNWRVMPAGDVRQCLAALTGKEFLNNRVNWPFFRGHKIGNIFLAILEKVTGDFERGLNILSSIFGSRGKIIPITRDDAELKISFSDGSEILGESNIDNAIFPAEVEKLSYVANVKLNPAASAAIFMADYLIIAPGNLFCSILPNFITDGFKETLKESRTKIIYVMNLVNKQGHTESWGEKKYLENIEKYLGKPVDFILKNSEEFSLEQIEQYSKSLEPEKIFLKKDLQGDPRIISCPLLSNQIFMHKKNDPVKHSLIRHNPDKLAECILEIKKIT